MTPVKVWQERVEIPTYETGPQDIHPMFLENRVYQGSSGAVYPYGVTDTLSEQKTLKSWQAGVAGKRLHQSDDPAGTGRSGASRMG
ncbi:hypothetical protein VEE15_45100 [Escherichia coli]|nr:hypothetical protein VEE15_45100 [Escherichia coli]